MIIDTHTHLFFEEDYQNYQKQAKSKVDLIITMHTTSYDIKHVFEFAENKKNVHVVAGINISKDLKKQLKNFTKYFLQNKIVGLKLYPGYQKFTPTDPRVSLFVELCQKYNKPLIIHSGDFYSPDGSAKYKYSHPIFIDELAVNYPKCNFIISHFAFPYMLEAAGIVYKNKNVYTDISGIIKDFQDKKNIENQTKQLIKDLQRVFTYYPTIKNKVMMGSDFSGQKTPYDTIQPYLKIFDKLYLAEEKEEVLYHLPKKLFFNPPSFT
ncbi:amidohydrolase family protein [Patescibacteria group bacterium]|nr:amidohydrolase family protein [Patescibacteria group bacterium]